MAKMTIEIPTRDTSKNDEIALVNRLVNTLAGTGSYMEMLFTEGMSDWFADKVMDDCSTDLFAEYEAMKVKLNEAMVDKNQAITDLLEVKEEREKESFSSKSLMAALANRNKELDQAMAASRDSVQALTEMRKENIKVGDENGRLKAQLVELKAALFDRMVASGEIKTVQLEGKGV